MEISLKNMQLYRKQLEEAINILEKLPAVSSKEQSIIDLIEIQKKNLNYKKGKENYVVFNVA